MAVSIRSACSADGPQIWPLLLQFAKSYSPSKETFDVTLGGLIGESRVRFLVIEEDGAVLGYALGFVLPTLFANGSILDILEVVIDESRRGEGLGRTLIGELLRVGWDCGCVEAVVPTRRATPFYEKLGFERTADYLKIRNPT